MDFGGKDQYIYLEILNFKIFLKQQEYLQQSRKRVS